MVWARGLNILKTTENNIAEFSYGKELTDRIAARHVATELPAGVHVVRTGNVSALIPAEEIVALVQLKNNAGHEASQGLVRETAL